MDVAQLLKDARYGAGLSSRIVAARAGLHRSTLSRYEAGHALPSLPALDRVLAVCGKEIRAELVPRRDRLLDELGTLAGQPRRSRLFALGPLLPGLVTQLGGTGSAVLIGGAWAAVLHGLPPEHEEGRLWVSGRDDELAAVAAVLYRRAAALYVDGEPCGVEVVPGLFRRRPSARWLVRFAGRFGTELVGPGEPWPGQVCVDDDELGPLRVATPERLVEDGVIRPELLAAWQSPRRDRPT